MSEYKDMGRSQLLVEIADLREQLYRAQNPEFSGRHDTWQAACGKSRGEAESLRNDLREQILYRSVERQEWMEYTDKLKAENERSTTREILQLAEIEHLLSENESLRANARLLDLLPELDEALEDLEIHGQHNNQGYRKLKDWYRKIDLACKAVDASMNRSPENPS